MNALRLWWRLTRHQDDLRTTTTLSLIAYASATACLVTVLGGLHAFVNRPEGRDTYPVLAATAAAILVIPIVTLGAAAARLSLSRRNDRLATLRLAGATTGQVAVFTLADAAVASCVGALLGVVGYVVVLPAVALLHFQGRAFRWSELWVGGWQLAAVVAGVTLLGVGSALFSLVGVAVTPLGVANRVTPRALSVLRLLVTLVVVALWSAVLRQPSIAVIVGFLVVCFAVVNLVGPFLLGRVGRLAARRASNAARLLAARRLVDDPRSAWRIVAGVALATSVAGVLSIAPAFSAELADELPTLGADIMTGAIVTLVIAALLAAVSSGVTQTARLLDQQRQYQALHLAGTDIAVLQQARLREVWLPLWTAVTLAAVLALGLVAPIGLSMLVRGWTGLVLFVSAAAGAMGLVMASVALTQGMVPAVAGALPREE